MAGVFTNPIGVDRDYADPFVLRFNGRYYLYCTTPDVQCWTSTDLLRWSDAGPTISDDQFPGLVPFAPEVFYADGWFYMLTSPHGRGHYILRASSPTGPFEIITGNVGRTIDGHVFIDDDGRRYFYWAGWEGIWACEMTSETEFGEAVLTGAHMNGWTEGPFVAKRDGRYYMTLTGNHFLSTGYRVNVAVSDHPITGYVDDVRNPVLLSTSGPAVGLGHSSSVRGPDLVSTYLAYHSIRPDRRRDLNLDRQVWSGRSLSALGPSRRALVPAPPDVESRWPEAASDWEGVQPAAGDADWGLLPAGRARWATPVSADSFTLELNLAPEAGVRVDVRLAADRDEVALLSLDAATSVVRVGGHDVPLPPGFTPDAPHLMRLEMSGNELSVFLDGRRQHTGTWIAGEWRFVVEATGNCRIGHCALTHTTPSAADRDAVVPVPGRFWAASATGDVPVRAASENGRGDALLLGDGETAALAVLPSEAGSYRVFAIGHFPRDVRVHLECGSTVVSMRRTSDAVHAAEVALPDDVARLQLRVTGGDAEIEQIQVAPVVSAPPVFEPRRFAANTKRLLVDHVDDEVEMSMSLFVDRATVDGHADLLLAASNLALGYEGDDERLGCDFLLGYSVQVHADHLVLARHDYNHTVVARDDDFRLAGDHDIRVLLSGGVLRVEVDGVRRFDWSDPRPHLVGGVGVRTIDASAHIRTLTVEPLSAS